MDLINQLFAFFFRAFLLIIGMIFVLGLMAFAAVFLLVAVVWSLLTGQKHPVQMVWSRARNTRDQVWRASRGGRFNQGPVSDAQEARADVSDVTDITDVTDVKEITHK